MNGYRPTLSGVEVCWWKSFRGGGMRGRWQRRGLGEGGQGRNAGREGAQYQDETQSHHLQKTDISQRTVEGSFHQCASGSGSAKQEKPTIRQVPVWVEAILQEWGTIFPEIKDCNFWSCCRRDLNGDRGCRTNIQSDKKKGWMTQCHLKRVKYLCVCLKGIVKEDNLDFQIKMIISLSCRDGRTTHIIFWNALPHKMKIYTSFARLPFPF